MLRWISQQGGEISTGCPRCKTKPAKTFSSGITGFNSRKNIIIAVSQICTADLAHSQLNHYRVGGKP